MSTKQDGNSFTARDFELLAGAMQCTKEPIQVDYKRFAETFEFKNPASAKASWNGLKKKLGKMAGGSVAPSLSITPGDAADKGGKGGKKRKAAEDDDDKSDTEPEEEASAKSKKKGRKAPLGISKGKKAAAAAAPTEDQDDDEEMPADETKGESNVKAEGGD